MLKLLASIAASVLLSSIPHSSLAQAPAQPFDAAHRGRIIDGVEREMSTYIDPKVAQAVRERLEADRATLLLVEDPKEFAKEVSARLYDVSHDLHLKLYYSELPPQTGTGPPTPSQLAHFRRFMVVHNSGVVAAAWLPGNIGYIRLVRFGQMGPATKHAIDAAMAVVANTDALLIDVRANRGGDGDSAAYLLGYLFTRKTELNTITYVWPQRKTVRSFTAEHVAGPHYTKPAYVLLGNGTRSAGEGFAYDLQALHRATLVGETTGGAGNPGDMNGLDDHFAVFVPNGRVTNPYTKTNWEGVGVNPDVRTAPAAALKAAYVMALKASKNDFDALVEDRKNALDDPDAALRTAFPNLE